MGSGELMSISLNPELERRLRERAAAEGLSVDAYLDNLVREDQSSRQAVESLITEAYESGEPIDIGPGYWEEKHRRLDERLDSAGR